MAIIRNYVNKGSFLSQRKLAELIYFSVYVENDEGGFYCVFTDEKAAELFCATCGVASAEIFTDYHFVGID